MNDTNGAVEMMRRQMVETKSHLTDRIGTLEQHVSETIQSTSGTLNAVQETVETVHGAVRSMSNSLNVRRQVAAHPWPAFGVSVALGFLASRILAGRPMKPAPTPIVVLGPTAAGVVENAIGNPVQAASTSAAIVAAYGAGLEYSASHRTRSPAIDVLAEVARSVAVHAVPLVLNYFAGHPSEGGSNTEKSGERQDRRSTAGPN